MIILLLLIAIGACGAAGYAWWMLHKQQSGNGTQTTEVKKNEPPAAPIFLALDTFTVNLQTADNDPDRVLYVGLTLRLPDEKIALRLMNTCLKFAAACCCCSPVRSRRS